MIVVVGRVRTDAEHRDELLRLGRTITAASRADEGCLSYRLYEDAEVPNDFVIVEEWASEAALQRHFATPHIAAFMAAFPATLIAPPDVQFHTVAGSRDLAEVSAAR